MLETIFINKDASNIGRRNYGEATLVGERIAAIHQPWIKARRYTRKRHLHNKACLIAHGIQSPRNALQHGNSDPFGASASSISLGPLHNAALGHVRNAVLSLIHIESVLNHDLRSTVLGLIDKEFQRTIETPLLLHSILVCALQQISKSCPGDVSVKSLGSLLLYHQSKQIELLRETVEQDEYGLDVMISVMAAADVARSNGEWDMSRFHLEALNHMISIQKGKDVLKPILTMQGHLTAIDMEVASQLSLPPCLNLIRTSGSVTSKNPRTRIQRVQMCAEMMLAHTLWHCERLPTFSFVLAEEDGFDRRAYQELRQQVLIQRNTVTWSLILFQNELDQDMRAAKDTASKRVTQYLQALYLATEYGIRVRSKGTAPRVTSYCVPEPALYENLIDFVEWYIPDNELGPKEDLPPYLELNYLHWTIEEQCTSVLWILLVLQKFLGDLPWKDVKTFLPWSATKFQEIRRLMINRGLLLASSASLLERLSMYLCDEDHFGDLARKLCDDSPAEIRSLPIRDGSSLHRYRDS